MDLAMKYAKESNNGQLPSDFTIYVDDDKDPGYELNAMKYIAPVQLGLMNDAALVYFLESMEATTTMTKTEVIEGFANSVNEQDKEYMYDTLSKIVPITSIEIKEGITKVDGLHTLGYAGSLALPSTTKSFNSGIDIWLTELTLNEGLETLFNDGLNTFVGEHITIPSTVTSISYGVSNKDNLKTVTILGDSTRFDAQWANLFGSATKIAG